MLKYFSICDSCSGYYRGYPEQQINEALNEEVEYLTTTTSNFSYCSVCNRYTNNFKNPYVLQAKVELEEKEPCDCYEKHGSVQHNDGGNYHHTTYKVIGEIKLIKLKKV